MVLKINLLIRNKQFNATKLHILKVTNQPNKKSPSHINLTDFLIKSKFISTLKKLIL
jgi:hypothetical protein